MYAKCNKIWNLETRYQVNVVAHIHNIEKKKSWLGGSVEGHNPNTQEVYMRGTLLGGGRRAQIQLIDGTN
jgi:hypothetical protein